MNTLPSFRRLAWLPGTFLGALAAMIALLIFATTPTRMIIGVGVMIVLGLGGGLLIYRLTRNQRQPPLAVPAGGAAYSPPANFWDETEAFPALTLNSQPSRWPRLKALMRAAPLLGIGLAFAINPQSAGDFFSARPADSLRSVIAVTLFALGFALSLAWRPYALRHARPVWLCWAALVVMITEWFTLYMLFTATFNSTYQSAIAPALLALAPVLHLLALAREQMNRRYAAQFAGETLSGPGVKPNRWRALWRSGAARLVIFALGLVALAAYILLAAPTLHGPSIVVRVWPVILAVGCALLPRGVEAEAQTLA